MEYARAIGRGVRSGLDGSPLNLAAGIFIGGGMATAQYLAAAVGAALVVYIMLRDKHLS